MLTCADGKCALSGAVTIRNAAAVLEEGKRLFSGPSVIVDLAAVTELDSSAVSLLLEWRRAAKAQNRRVQYVNIPANLQSLADLYGVSELLARD